MMATDNPIPELDRMSVTNYERWGKLVMSWATNRNCLGDGNEYPRPKNGDLEEVKRQCLLAGVGATFPERITKLEIGPTELDTLYIRLPPPEFLALAAERLTADPTYPLPDFYADAFAVPGRELHFGTPEDALRFDAARLGDYTITNCAG